MSSTTYEYQVHISPYQKYGRADTRDILAIKSQFTKMFKLTLSSSDQKQHLHQEPFVCKKPKFKWAHEAAGDHENLCLLISLRCASNEIIYCRKMWTPKMQEAKNLKSPCIRRGSWDFLSLVDPNYIQGTREAQVIQHQTLHCKVASSNPSVFQICSKPFSVQVLWNHLDGGQKSF